MGPYPSRPDITSWYRCGGAPSGGGKQALSRWGIGRISRRKLIQVSNASMPGETRSNRCRCGAITSAPTTVSTAARVRWSRLSAFPLRASLQVRRNCRAAAAGNDDGAWLTLLLSGKAHLKTDTAETDIQPGDIVYGRSSGSFRISFPGDFQQCFVSIPRSALNSRLLSDMDTGAGCIRGDSGMGRVFADMSSVAESMERLTADQMRPLEIALIDWRPASRKSRAVPCAARRARNDILDAHLPRIEFSLASIDLAAPRSLT